MPLIPVMPSLGDCVTRLARSCVLSSLAVLLASCGGGGGGGGSMPAPATVTVGGTVAGLAGSGLILSNDGGNSLAVSASGAFTFTAALSSGASYQVTVAAQPSYPAQTCSVANGAGTTGAANVTNVTVTCTNQPVASAQLGLTAQGAVLSWSDVGATSNNVYLSTSPDCDVTSIASCPGGAKLTAVTSPYTVTGLAPDTDYFFYVESEFAGGAKGLSNEVATRPNEQSTNGPVTAVAVGPDGTVYVGGSFTRVGLLPGRAVPLDATTAQLTTPTFPTTNSRVRAIVADGAGGWYLGGDFTAIGNVQQSYLAHVLASGAVDTTFAPVLDNLVTALANANGALYVSGQFQHAGASGGATVARKYFAAVDPVSGVALAWNPGADGPALTFVASGTTLYAGGSFQNVGGSPHAMVAEIDGQTGSVLPWTMAENLGAFGHVDALVLSGNTLYMGGLFYPLPAQFPAYAAAADVTSGATVPWALAPDDEVEALVLSGGNFYLGGAFNHVNGAPRTKLAAVTGAGALLPWNPVADGGVTSLVASGSTLYVGGAFSIVAGVQRDFVAAVDANSGNALPWDPEASGNVLTLALAGTTLCVGGEFTTIGGSVRNGLAAYDPSGRLLPWNPTLKSVAPNLPVVAALAAAGSTVYVGGQFRAVGGTPRAGLAAVDGTSGAVLGWDGALQFGQGLEPSVGAILVDGPVVYVGGAFTSAGVASRANLAALDATTGIALGWNSGADGAVATLALSGQTLYAGGSFIQVGGLARPRLAAIDASSGAVLAALPAPNAPVAALATGGANAYFGGPFTAVEAATNYAIGAFSTGTFALLPWNPNPYDPNTSLETVLAIVATPQQVYLGGQFQAFGTGVRNSLAAVDASGNLLPWAPAVLVVGAPATTSVNALAVSGTVLYAGGTFNTVSGISRYNFVALDATSGQVLP